MTSMTTLNGMQKRARAAKNRSEEVEQSLFVMSGKDYMARRKDVIEVSAAKRPSRTISQEIEGMFKKQSKGSVAVKNGNWRTV